MNDYNVQIRVRNNRILRRIRDLYGTSADMCRETGLRPTAVSEFLGFRKKPFLENGDLVPAAENLCSALGATPEELWPAEMSEVVAKKATFELELTQVQAMSLCSSAEQDVISRQMIEKWSEGLSNRQRIAIEALSKGVTIDELGKELGVSGGNAWLIQRKALRKMRHRAFFDDGIRTYGEVVKDAE